VHILEFRIMQTEISLLKFRVSSKDTFVDLQPVSKL